MIFDEKTIKHFHNLLTKLGFDYVNDHDFVADDLDCYLMNNIEINVSEGTIKDFCSCYIDSSSGEICVEYEIYFECEDVCCNRILFGKDLKISYQKDYNNFNFLPIVKFINEYLCFTNLIKVYNIRKADDVYELLSMQ